MSRFARFAFVLLLIAAVCTAQNAPTSAPKKRVAVMNFDYGTVRSAVAAIWGTDQDVGKGIADPGSLIEAVMLAATLAQRRTARTSA